jgi:hypothetical protein
MADSEKPRSKSQKPSQARAGSGTDPQVSRPAKKKSSAKKTPAKSAGKPRVCRYLFVLGSGVDPGEQAETLRSEFEKTPGLDFSQAQQHVVGIGKWKSQDKEALRKSVIGFLEAWFAAREETLDEKRLLIRDYQNDDHRFAVAGYFPSASPSSSSDVAPASVESPNLESSSSADDDPDMTFAEAKKPPGFAQKVIAGLKHQPPKRLAIIASVVVGLAVVGAILPSMLSGDPAGDGTADQNASDTTNGDVKAGDNRVAALPLPLPQFQIGVVRVYTPEAGFRVLVDGQPVRNAEGEFVTTPCAITAKQGTRTITVYREGYLDASSEVIVKEDSETEIAPNKDKAQIGSNVLSAPHLEAKVGVPIPLEKINSLRPEFDPYVTPDQLAVWFVGDRLDGRGIFVATRQSPLHDFDEPRLISRSTDLPGSPSVTDDALLVVYAVPKKARLMALKRSNPLSKFTEKQPIRHSKSFAPTWPSAQILGDGTRVYWVEIGSKETRTLVASRSDERRDFGEMVQVTMPGIHPCLTTDGLRQFTYDGKEIKRYRRLSPKKRFTTGEVIAELELENYTPSKNHRQFFITADEQWMFYCDDPDKSGDLFMVRIAKQPQWGVVARGKTISPKPVVVAVKEPVEPVPDMPKEKKPDKPVDPRALPLSYTSHWKIFSTLISSRQYTELEGLLRIAKANTAMQPFAEQLKWDEEELTLIQQFWKDVDVAASELKKGDQIRIGKFQVDFQEYKDGELYTRRGVNPIRRKLTELTPSELLGVYDRKFKSDDFEAQYRAALFLAYDKDTLPRSVKNRMDKAGDLAEKFNERQVRRALAQGVAELERANFAQGVAFLNDVKERAKGTPIEQEVIALEQKLYTYIKWNKRGKRQWQQEAVGNAYIATLGANRGSLLMSEREYKNFEMSLEWKVVDASTAQGGVFFRYRGQGDLTDNAFKIHLANDAGINADPYATGSLFSLVAPDENAAKVAGEWNTTVIKYVDKDITVTVNGKKVLETIADNPDIDNIPEKGYVALDGEAGGITYRKVLLSELP